MGIFTWDAINKVGSDVRRSGRNQEKLLKVLVEQNLDSQRCERARSRQDRPDPHTEWLAHLEHETPIAHPAIREHGDAAWLSILTEGYGDYPRQWSLASIRVRRELRQAGWDVDKLMAELRPDYFMIREQTPPRGQICPPGPTDGYAATED